MFHGYHATEVMAEHRRRVRDVTARAHLLGDADARAARRASRWSWRRRTGATTTPHLESPGAADLAPATR